MQLIALMTKEKHMTILTLYYPLSRALKFNQSPMSFGIVLGSNILASRRSFYAQIGYQHINPGFFFFLHFFAETDTL
jgi:hypothetical protein